MLRTCYIRLIDRQPTHVGTAIMSDITGGVKVGVKLETTRPTAIARAVAVTFVGVSTMRTLLRRVTGIDKHDVLTGSFRFVSQELFKLVERPRVEKPVHLSTPSLLHPYLAKVFKCEDGSRRRDERLADTVVNVSHKPSFPSAYLLKLPFSGTGAFGLKFSAKVGVFPSRITRSNALSIEKRVIGTDRDVFYASVDAEHVTTANGWHVHRFHRDVQEKPLAIRDSNAFHCPCEVLPITLWGKETRFHSPGNRSDRSEPIVESDTNDTVVIPHSRTRFLLRERFALTPLERLTCAVSRTLHKRRGKRRTSTKLVIRPFMILNFIPRVVFKAPLRRGVECFGVFIRRSKELLSILIGKVQLERNSAYHRSYIDLVDKVDTKWCGLFKF